jgi:Coenzyme PQQ synthesis protein D (PqqD)
MRQPSRADSHLTKIGRLPKVKKFQSRSEWNKLPCRLGERGGRGVGRMLLYRVHNKNIVSEIIDEEAIIMDLATGTYFSADGAGAVIWDGIVSGFEADQIKQRIGQVFAAERADVSADFEKFVASLVTHRLVDVGHGTAFARREWSAALPDHRRDYLPPVLNSYNDLQDLALLDPIHDVEETGWPNRKEEPVWPNREEDSGWPNRKTSF